MKINTRYKNVIKPVCLIAGLIMSTSTFANLINKDFSDGLNNWSADYSYFDGAQEFFYEPVTDFSTFTDNFSTNADKVTLNTSVDGANEYFGLYFNQQFQVASDAFELSLNFEYLADYAYVTLVDSNLDLLHDFMNDGLSVDISSFEGDFVSLEFGIEDIDFVYDDYLTVSNISISEKAQLVPEPSTFALFILALLSLRSRIFSRK